VAYFTLVDMYANPLFSVTVLVAYKRKSKVIPVPMLNEDMLGY